MMNTTILGLLCLSCVVGDNNSISSATSSSSPPPPPSSSPSSSTQCNSFCSIFKGLKTVISLLKNPRNKYDYLYSYHQQIYRPSLNQEYILHGEAFQPYTLPEALPKVPISLMLGDSIVTTSELAAVELIRRRISDLQISADTAQRFSPWLWTATDIDIVRFLRHQHGKVEEAWSKILKHAIWRISANGILSLSFPLISSRIISISLIFSSSTPL